MTDRCPPRLPLPEPAISSSLDHFTTLASATAGVGKKRANENFRWEDRTESCGRIRRNAGPTIMKCFESLPDCSGLRTGLRRGAVAGLMLAATWLVVTPPSARAGDIFCHRQRVLIIDNTPAPATTTRVVTREVVRQVDPCPPADPAAGGHQGRKGHTSIGDQEHHSGRHQGGGQDPICLPRCSRRHDHRDPSDCGCRTGEGVQGRACRARPDGDRSRSPNDAGLPRQAEAPLGLVTPIGTVGTEIGEGGAGRSSASPSWSPRFPTQEAPGCPLQ